MNDRRVHCRWTTVAPVGGLEVGGALIALDGNLTTNCIPRSPRDFFQRGSDAVLSRLSPGHPAAHGMVPVEIKRFPKVLARTAHFQWIQNRQTQVEQKQKPELVIPEVRGEGVTRKRGEVGSGVRFPLPCKSNAVPHADGQREFAGDPVKP